MSFMAHSQRSVRSGRSRSRQCFANVKINIGEILSIDEKLEKYNETAY